MSQQKQKHFSRQRNRFGKDVKDSVKKELKFDVEGSSSEPNQQSIRSSRIESFGSPFTERTSSVISATFQQSLKKIITISKNDFVALLKDKLFRQEIKKEQKKVTKLRTDQKITQQTDIQLSLAAINNLLSVSDEVISSFSKEEKPKPTVRVNQEKEMTKQLAIIDQNIASNNFGVVKTTIQGLLKRFGKDQFLDSKIGYLTFMQITTQQLQRKSSFAKQMSDYLERISVIDVSTQQNVVQSSTALKGLKRDLTMSLNKQNKKVEPNAQTLGVLSQLDRTATLLTSFVQPKIEKKGVRREVSMSKQMQLKGIGSNDGLQQTNKYLKDLFEKSSEDKDLLFKQLQNLKRNKKKSIETPYNILIRLYDQINANKKQINEANLYLKNVSQIFIRKNLSVQNLNLQLKKAEEKYGANQTIGTLKANLEGLISSVQEREKSSKQGSLLEQQIKKLKLQNQKLAKINEDLKGKIVDKVAEEQKVDKRKQLEERRLKEAEKAKVQKFEKELQKNFDNIFTNLNQKKWKISKNAINIFVKKYEEASNPILPRSIQSMNTINNLLSEIQTNQNQIIQFQKREKAVARDFEKQKEGLLQKIKGMQEYEVFMKELLSNINQEKYPLKKVFDDLKKDRKRIVQERYLLLDKLEEPLSLWRSRKENQNITFQLSMDSVGPETSKSRKQRSQLQVKYKELEGKAGEMSKDIEELLSLIKRIQRGGEWWKFIPKNIKNNATFKPVYAILQQYRKYQLNIQALKTNSALIKQEDKSIVDAIALSLSIVEKQNDFSEDFWQKKLATFKGKDGGENLIKLLKTYTTKSNQKFNEESQRLKLEIERLQRSLNDRDKSHSHSRHQQSSSKQSADMRSSRRSSRSRDNKQSKSKELLESYIQDERNYLDKIEEIKQQKLKVNEENQSLQLKVKAIQQQLIKAEEKCFILEEAKSQLQKEKYQQFGEVSHLRGELQIAEGRITEIQTKMESQINQYKQLYEEVSRKIVEQSKKHKQIGDLNVMLKQTIQTIKIKTHQTDVSPSRVEGSGQRHASGTEGPPLKFKFNMDSKKVVDFFDVESSVRRRPKKGNADQTKEEKVETVPVEVQINPLQQKIQFLTSQLISLSDKYQLLSAQNSRLNSLKSEFENQLNALRQRIRVLSLQNNNLMMSNANLTSEVNGVKQKNQIFAEQNARLGALNVQLTNELTNLRQKLRFLTEENKRLSSNQEVNSELVNLRERFRILTLDNTRLTSQLNNLAKGLNNYKQNIQHFTSQNNRLLLVITDLTTENNALKIKIENIISTGDPNAQLLKDIEELKKQNNLLKQQLVRFNLLKEQEILNAVQVAVQKEIDGFNIFLLKDQTEREKYFMQVILPKFLQQQRLKFKTTASVSSKIDINSVQFLTLYNQKLSVELQSKMQIFITNFMQQQLPKIIESKKSEWTIEFQRNFNFDREMWQLIKLDEWTARQIVIAEYWNNILIMKEKEWYDKYHSMKKEATIVYKTHPDDREMWEMAKAEEWTARQMTITDYWQGILEKKEREWYDKFHQLKKEQKIVYKTNPEDRQMWELTKAEEWITREMSINQYWNGILQKKERQWYDKFHSLKRESTIVNVNQWSMDDRIMWQMIKADQWTARQIVIAEYWNNMLTKKQKEWYDKYHSMKKEAVIVYKTHPDDREMWEMTKAEEWTARQMTITDYWQGILEKKEREWYDKFHQLKKEQKIVYKTNPEDRQMWEMTKAEEWTAREMAITDYWNGLMQQKQKEWYDKFHTMKKQPTIIYKTNPQDRQMWELTKNQEWTARQMTITDYWNGLLQKKEKQWYDKYFLLKNQRVTNTIQTNDFDRVMWQLIKADEWTARQIVIAEYWNNILLMKQKEWYQKYHLLKKNVSYVTMPVSDFDRITWQSVKADQWKARESQIENYWNGILFKKEKQWDERYQNLTKQLNERSISKTQVHFNDVEMLELLRKDEYRQVINVIINDAWTQWAHKQDVALKQLQKEIQNYYQTVAIPKIIADLHEQKKREIEAFQALQGTEAIIEQWKAMFLGAIVEQERHTAINLFVENELPNILGIQYNKWVAGSALQIQKQKQELIERELSNLNARIKQEKDKLEITFTSKLSQKEIFYQAQIIEWQQKTFQEQARTSEFQRLLKIERQNLQKERTTGKSVAANEVNQNKYESQIAFLQSQLKDLKAKCSFYEQRQLQINKKIEELEGNYVLKMQSEIQSTLASKLATFQTSINSKAQAQLVRRLQQQKKLIRNQLQIQIRQEVFMNIKSQIQIDLRSQLGVVIKKQMEQQFYLKLTAQREMWEKAKIEEINMIMNAEYQKWEITKQNEIKVILLENDKKWEQKNIILLQNQRNGQAKKLQTQLSIKKSLEQEYKRKLEQELVIRLNNEKLVWQKQKEANLNNNQGSIVESAVAERLSILQREYNEKIIPEILHVEYLKWVTDSNHALDVERERWVVESNKTIQLERQRLLEQQKHFMAIQVNRLNNENVSRIQVERKRWLSQLPQLLTTQPYRVYIENYVKAYSAQNQEKNRGLLSKLANLQARAKEFEAQYSNSQVRNRQLLAQITEFEFKFGEAVRLRESAQLSASKLRNQLSAISQSSNEKLINSKASSRQLQELKKIIQKQNEQLRSHETLMRENSRLKQQNLGLREANVGLENGKWREIGELRDKYEVKILELTNERTTLLTRITEVEHVKGEYNQRELILSLERQIATLLATVKTKDTEITFLKRAIDNHKDELKEARDQYAVVSEQRSQLERQLGELKNARLEGEYELKYLQEREESLRKKLELKEQEVLTFRKRGDSDGDVIEKKIKANLETIASYQIKFAEIESLLSLKTQQCQSMLIDIDRLRYDVQRSEASIHSANLQIESLKIRLKDSQTQLSQSRSDRQRISEELGRVKLSLSQSVSRQQELSRQIQSQTRASKNFEGDRFRLEGELQRLNEQVVRLGREVAEAERTSRREADRSLQLERELREARSARPGVDVGEIEVLSKINSEVSELTATNRQLSMKVVLLQNREKVLAFSPDIMQFFLLLQRHTDILVDYLLRENVIPNLQVYHRFLAESRPLLAAGQVAVFFAKWQLLLVELFEVSLWSRGEEMRAQAEELLRLKEEMNEVLERQIEASEGESGQLVQDYKAVLVDIKSLVREFVQTGDREYVNLLCQSLGVAMK